MCHFYSSVMLGIAVLPHYYAKNNAGIMWTTLSVGYILKRTKTQSAYISHGNSFFSLERIISFKYCNYFTVLVLRIIKNNLSNQEY